MIDIEIDKKALKDIQEKFWVATIQNMLDKSIKKTIVLLNRYAIEETPTDRWLLRNSFKSEFKKSYWRLFNNT